MMTSLVQFDVLLALCQLSLLSSLFLSCLKLCQQPLSLFLNLLQLLQLLTPLSEGREGGTEGGKEVGRGGERERQGGEGVREAGREERG